MKCSNFKKYWIDGDINQLSYDLQDEVLEHLHNCKDCGDLALKKTLETRGVIVKNYPCVHMAQYAEFYCEQHPDPKDCNDSTVLYDEAFDEYAIQHGDGISQLVLNYCPWCGTELPSSKRDLWFDTLEELGFDEPFEQEIPKRFKSKQWRI